MNTHVAFCKCRSICFVQDTYFVENNTQDHLVFVTDLCLDEGDHVGFDIVREGRIFDAIMSVIRSGISEFQETFGIPDSTTDLLFG